MSAHREREKVSEEQQPLAFKGTSMPALLGDSLSARKHLLKAEDPWKTWLKTCECGITILVHKMSQCNLSACQVCYYPYIFLTWTFSENRGSMGVHLTVVHDVPSA